jgi:hypothetical protein
MLENKFMISLKVHGILHLVVVSCFISLKTQASNYHIDFEAGSPRNVPQETSSVVDLRRFSIKQGFKIYGAEAGERSGTFVGRAGDPNDDGIADMFVSTDPSSGTITRSVYIIYGKSGGYNTTVDLANLTEQNGFRIYGARIKPADVIGDFNGDGIDDVIFGAPTDAPNGNIAAGSVYIVYGKQGGYSTAINLSTLNATIGFRIDGNGGQLGYAVSGVGDVNGDGLKDVAFSARYANFNGKSQAGFVYVLYGRPGGYNSTIALNDLDPSAGFRMNGAVAGGHFGAAVHAVGDFNGDDLKDIAVSAPFAGSSFIIYGKPGGYNRTLEMDTLSPADGFSIEGASVYCLTSGDFNGDRISDVGLGAEEESPGGKENAGSVFILYGKEGGYNTTVDLKALSPLQGLQVNGGKAGDHAGAAVSFGYFNNDEHVDLIIGAPYTDLTCVTDGGTPYDCYLGGSIYVFYGRLGGFNTPIELANFTGSYGPRFNGGFPSNAMGWSVGYVGDINMDGIGDFAFSGRAAGLYYNEKSGSGVTFVVYGTDSSNSSVPSTTGSGGDPGNNHSAAGTRQSFLQGTLTYLKSFTSWWSRPLESPILTPEQQKLVKLKEKVENSIRHASHLDKWYVYSLEDFVEDLALTLQHPKNIDAMTVKHFNRRLKGIHEDFKSEPYNKHAAMPLLLENHDYGQGTPLSYGCFLPALTPALMNAGHLYAIGH